MYFHTPIQIIWGVLLLVVTVFSLWKGGTPERIVAVAGVAASLITPLMPSSPLALDPKWGTLMLDSVFFLLLLGLALRTDRTWLLFACAFQLLQIVTHAAIMTDNVIGTRALMSGLIIWSFMVLLSQAVGAWSVWKERLALTQS